jgi:hypothetical protein
MTSNSQGTAIVHVDGKDIDLVPLVGIIDDLTPDERRLIWPADRAEKLELGEVAYTLGFGQWRRGVITKIGRKRVTVAFTTPSTVTEAMRKGWAISIYSPPHDAGVVYVSRPLEGLVRA